MAPNIISRQQWRLREKWLSEEQAKRIAFKNQRDTWNTVKNTFQLSENGKWYSELWPIEREIIRRSNKSGKPPSAYTVVNWKVVLKK